MVGIRHSITGRSARAVLWGAAIALLAGGVSQVQADGAPTCSCHTAQTSKTYLHQPVKDGDCNSCHKPAGQQHPAVKQGAFVLTDKGRSGLCYECHDRKDTKKQVHPPVAAGDCLDCHDPHGSTHRYQLKETGAALCFGCHDKSAFEHSVSHKPVKSGLCTSCHDPHQSDFRFMLKAEGANLCLKCHDKELFNGASVHAPVARGDCAACHAPHGSANHHLLKRATPESLYQSFDKSNFALCFGCHSDRLADDQRTGTETMFRNGMFNLHFVHVNRAEKGRSCKVCHDPHAASQPHLISAKISGLGRWRIPIRYKKTADGGTCVVGCHKPKSYNRLDPVKNP